MTVVLDSLKASASAGDLDSQLQLGQYYLTRNQHSRARRWLQRAAGRGSLMARAELALMEVFQRTRSDARAAALAELRDIAAAGDGKANYYLACFYLTGYATDIDLEVSLNHFAAAVAASYPAAQRTYGLLLLLADPAGNSEQALGLLESAALAGDAYAPFACARVLMESDNPEWSSIKSWLILASQQPLELSKGVAQLAASIEQPATELVQAPSKESLVPTEWPAFSAEQVSYSEEVVYPIEKLLPRAVCDYLINYAAPSLRPSEVVNPKTGDLIRNPVRTSSSTNSEAMEPDILFDFVCRYLCHLSGKKPVNAEPLAILRYQPGEEYRKHFDFFAPSAFEQQPELTRGGQRDITALVYLNNVSAGGQTEFPELDVSIEPVAGSGIVFRNCDAQGEPLLKSLHAGKPVLRGEKWLLSQWFRREPVR